MPNPETVKIKQIRRHILEAFNMMYPTAMQIETIYRVIIGTDPAYQWHLFEKDIAYLTDKQYLACVDDTFDLQLPARKKTYKLTAAGKDIADRTRTDPALEI